MSAPKLSLTRAETLGLLLGGVVLVGAGLGAWFGLGALSEQQAEAQALAGRMANPALAALLADPGGVNRAKRESDELRQVEKVLLKERSGLTSVWSNGTKEATGEGQEWAKDPGKWKDRLIEIQNELQKKGPARKVQLNPEFYLGLEAYRQKSPGPEEVPALALHLSVAQRLVELLMEARQIQEQYPTPCEFRSLTGPGSGPEKTMESRSPGPKKNTEPAQPEGKSFTVEIRCSPEVLYEYTRLLAQDSWLFIIRDVALGNEKQSFPLRSEIAKKFSQNEKGSAEAQPGRKRLLEVLAGQEALMVTLLIDFVPWRNAEGTKAGGPSAQAP